MKMDDFSTLLKIRSYLKQISQISFSISAFEKHFPLENLDEEGWAKLMAEYSQSAEEIQKIISAIDKKIEAMKGGKREDKDN